MLHKGSTTNYNISAEIIRREQYVWETKEMRTAMARYFGLCLTAIQNNDPKHHLSWALQGVYLSLTCSCGIACTLEFRYHRTAAFWASQFSTARSASVLGCIQTANLRSFSVRLNSDIPEL
jgi:hypothetical protein